MAVRQVQGALMGPLMGIQDAFALAVPTPPILGLGNTSGFKLYLEDRGNIGTVELFNAANAVLAAAHKRPELSQQTYTFSTLGVPRLQVDVDREKVLSQGLKLSDIYDAMQGYFGTIYVNDFNRFGRTWQVNIQGDADYRSHIADFQRVKIKNAQGVMVPLASYIRISETAGTDSAVQYNTFPAIDINSGAAPGYSSDQAQDAMIEVLKQTLPSGVTYEFTELTYQQILAGNTAVYVFPVCVLLVFLVLAAFYESLTLPLAIVLIVPMCLFSALVGVNLIHGDNNIMTQIGLIVLVGLACKNAILIVEFAKEAEIEKKMDPFTAALEACRLRLRPILMTSVAFIMGVVPLVLATGAGAELRHSTGTAVFAGMIGVTFFGLLLTPVFYVTLRRLAPGKLHGHHDQDQETP
jgi:multidrug efflux pump